jgi:hypothetical protein
MPYHLLEDKEMSSSKNDEGNEDLRDKKYEERRRLVKECANLDPEFEKSMAEQWLSEDLSQWPEY